MSPEAWIAREVGPNAGELRRLGTSDSGRDAVVGAVCDVPGRSSHRAPLQLIL